LTKPQVKITVDGENVSAQIMDRLISLTLTDNADGKSGDTLQLTLDDRDQTLQVPTAGQSISLSIGINEGEPLVEMGKYGVTECGFAGGSSGFTLTVSATSAGVVLKDHINQSWHDLVMGDVLKEIGERNGLLTIIDAAIASQKLPHIDQTEGDGAFLQRLAKQQGVIIKPTDGKLTVTKKGAAVSAKTAKDISQTINLIDCISYSATAKTKTAASSVDAKFVESNAEGKPKTKTVKVLKPSDQSKATPAPAGFKPSTKKSSDALPRAGDSKVYANKEEAKKAAESKLQTMAAGEYSFNAKVIGNPKFTAGGKVKLVGFRKELSSLTELEIKSVTHNISASGYFTDISCATPGAENNDFSVGKDGSKGSKSSGSGSICAAVKKMGAFSSRSGPDGGNNACVWAVNKILREAGRSTPWGGSNYVPAVHDSLRKGSGTLLNSQEDGAIVILRDNKSPPEAHIGISCGGQIYSNSSSKASFSWIASEASYTAHYGRKPLYYRLK